MHTVIEMDAGFIKSNSLSFSCWENKNRFKSDRVKIDWISLNWLIIERVGRVASGHGGIDL